MSQSDNFDVFIVVLPPGINKTYASTINPKTNKSRIYKTKEAKEWSEKAALIIGSRAAELDFVPSGEYKLVITTHGSKMDVDAPIKLIQDTLCEKLGFDDRLISEVEAKKDKLGKGLRVKLEKNDVGGVQQEKNAIQKK
jgi:Holliday junction resolvase RusA-like endonuclease